MDTIPDGIKRLVFDLLDGPSWGSLRQVSRGFSGQSQDDRIWDRARNRRAEDYAMNKFYSLKVDIRMMARGAETYTEVVTRSETMAEDAMDPGMVDYVRTHAYNELLHSILDSAAGTIAYSQDSTLEEAGSEDVFKVWALVEAEAY